MNRIWAQKKSETFYKTFYGCTDLQYKPLKFSIVETATCHCLAVVVFHVVVLTQILLLREKLQLYQASLCLTPLFHCHFLLSASRDPLV